MVALLLWICIAAVAVTLVATTMYWFSVAPVAAAVNGAVLLGCVVVLWNTTRHVPRSVRVSDAALTFAPYLGPRREMWWDDVRTIREFAVIGWTARRHAVMLESSGRDWVAFFHDIDGFEDLRATVREHATSGVTKGAPPWWTRLARLGTV